MTDESDGDDKEFIDPLSNYEPRTYESEIAQSLVEDPVSMIPSRPYAHVDSATSVASAVQVLHGLNASCLLVVDADRLVGVFTERDVLERVADNFPAIANRPVRDVMTADPLVVNERDPAGAALAAIVAGGYRHVPVLNAGGDVMGVVSPRRVFAFFERHFQRGPR